MANANYLPVLLVSVTNAAPDDSYVSTQARAQVDYLSHEWQEEDVWKSWRNMTRQKNEIVNGVRLENASWRTWWKQRNKLKTVSPETLNWLKDSDVTWLYGPLHTAIDYKPPPKEPSRPETPSATSHKPILKHRSISQLLTSDLPQSPVFSPPHSDDEDQDVGQLSRMYKGLDLVDSKAMSKRPSLQHTKSDTHITRWGANRTLRKDSPPRVEPPGQQSLTTDYFPKVPTAGPVRTSQSQDSNSSNATSQSGERTTKKKHITFNTFVQQCIAIDKPKRNSSFYGDSWIEGRNYDDDDGYEEDQEDFPEDDSELVDAWDHQRIPYTRPDDSDSPDDEDDGIIEMRSSYRTKKRGTRYQSKVSNTSSSSTASSSTTNSAANSSSPSRFPYSSSRRSSTSTYRPRPPFIRTSTTDHVHVTIAPIAPTVLKTTGAWEESFGDDGGSDDGIGYRTYVLDHTKKSNSRWDDDENQVSDGTPVELVYVPPFNSRYAYGPANIVPEGAYLRASYDDDDEDDDEDEQGEGLREDYTIHSRTSQLDDTSPETTYLHRGAAIGSVGFEDYSEISGSSDSPERAATHSSSIPIFKPAGAYLDPSSPQSHDSNDQQIPQVVVEERSDDQGSWGPDLALGDEYMHCGRSRGRQGYGSRSRGSDERPSRSSRSISGTASSQSRSHSRTPSPALLECQRPESSASSNGGAASSSTLQPSGRHSLRRSNSSASSPTFAAVAAPPRGRSASHQDLIQASVRAQTSSGSCSRGRSSTRTSPSANWDSASPLGSLSPDASVAPRHAVPVGRSHRDPSDRDRGRGRESTRERRGRSATTDKRLAVSVSSSPDPSSGQQRGASGSLAPPSPAPSSSAAPLPVLCPPSIEASPSFSTSDSSSLSSATTAKPQCRVTAVEGSIHPGVEGQVQEAVQTDREAEYMRLAEEELRRRTTPTPSNSPTLSLCVGLGDYSSRASPSSSSTVTADASSSSRNGSATVPKARPPPLAPSPSHTVPPSTSYTAARICPSPTSGSKASPQLMTSAVLSPNATVDELPTGDDAVGQEIRTDSVKDTSVGKRGGGSRERQSRERGEREATSIIGKAADLVNSAGAFLGWWTVNVRSESDEPR